jgi:phosphomannomutase/phosphoglucomutase
MLKLKKIKKTAPEPDTAAETSTSKPQGITAKGDALRKIGAKALLTALVPVILGFAYLLLLREPALQQEQIDRVASSFAVQQATSIHHLISRIDDRVTSTAKSPLALSAIASGANEDIALVEKAILDYFPAVLSLRIIAIGDLGTADFAAGNKGLRNLIEVDMVRRTSEGEDVQPQAYKFENKWITSMVSRVTHPRITDLHAVIIVTIDNEQLSQQLGSLEESAGQFTLEQLFTKSNGAEHIDIIATSGSATTSPHTRLANVSGTSWRVAFSPSEQLLKDLSLSQIPLLSVLALIILAVVAAVIIMLKGFPKALAREVDKVVAAADQKSHLTLEIPELVIIAKQLRRATLLAMRKTISKVSAGIPAPEMSIMESELSESSNPIFQSNSMLDQEEEEMGLDLAVPNIPATPSPVDGRGIPENIFRAYDIRGHAQDELTDELISEIGKAIGSIASEMEEQSLIVGCDGRTSSPRIKSALIRALMETGRDVIDIGSVPTPLLYFATVHLNCSSGVMVTGSHNPAEHNGLKIVLNKQTIAAGGIQQIRDRVVSGNFITGNGRMTRENVVSAYQDAVLDDIAIAVPLKIVIDAGNGITGEIAPPLFRELGCEVVELNCEVDGKFPKHPPDTSNEDNLAELVSRVQEVSADFGVAFDGDGDRLAVVTSSGRIVRSDVLLMLYAQDVVSRNPGTDVVFDVKCSRNLTTLITRYGGRPVLWKTGHAFMKEKMKETGALLGGEFSGHMFFGERWYGFDDGMYAAGRLAEILGTHGESLDDSISQFPETVNTPEIIIPVADDYKFQLIEKIVSRADFSEGKVNIMDGIRVDFNNGWGLVRASNTGPALTARFEADSREDLAIIQEEFRAQIALIDPEINLNF